MSKQLLFIPGPVTVAEPVLAAMAKPLIDHRGPEYKALQDGVLRKLKPVFGTSGDVVLLGSSGTGGLEAAVTNLFTAGEKVLACPIGVFGDRLSGIAKTWGIDVTVLPTEWGRALDPQALAAALDADPSITGVLLTHNETSTGTQNDLGALAAVLRGRGKYVVVDSVSGLAASEFTMDAWGFDVVAAASQKALAVPPGLAMVAASARAWEKMAASAAPRYYFDLRKAREFAEIGQNPWTPPVSVVYALDVALDRYAAETPAAVWARHDRYARAIRAAGQALGLELFSADGAHSVTVVALKVPAGVDGDGIRKTLRTERNVVLGGGQGRLKGQIMRIGTMGDLTQTDVLGMLGALEMELLASGAPVQAGVGVQAALRVFLAAEGAAVPA